MATKVLIDTRNNKFIQFETEYQSKLRIEKKTDIYDTHCGYICSKQPLSQWKSGTKITYYRRLFFAIKQNLPSERYKLVINGVNEWKEGKYFQIDKYYYIYPLTALGDLGVRHILFGDKPNEDELEIDIEMFKYVTPKELPFYMNIDRTWQDVIEIE